jgi:drug/metabolite transporter (DMT)-like permease
MSAAPRAEGPLLPSLRSVRHGPRARPISLLIVCSFSIFLLRGRGAEALVTPTERGEGLARLPKELQRSGSLGTRTLASPSLRLYGGDAAAQPVKPKRAVAGLELFVMVVLWYGLNVGWNLANKNLCNMIKLPITASAMQMSFGLMLMISQWMMKTRRMPRSEDWHNPQLQGLGFVHAMAQITTISAFSFGTVSFVSVIKALEPLYSASLGVPLLGDRLPLRCWLSMLPVCGGIAMASLGELSFSWICFLLSQASNLCYALRSVWFKKVFDEAKAEEKPPDGQRKRKIVGKSGWTLSATTGFPVASVYGWMIVVMTAIVLEGSRFRQGLDNVKSAGKTVKDLALLCALTGTCPLQATHACAQRVVTGACSLRSRCVAV